MLMIDCMACQDGDHANHTPVIQAAPPRMIGGTGCPCTGDCAERNAGRRLPGIFMEARPLTWRDKIKDAAEGVEKAYETRRTVFKAASDAGLSMRQIADAAGISAAMVCRDIGNAKTPRTSLDDEAPDAA